MGITIIPSPGTPQGSGNLTTAGAIVYVVSAGTITQDPTFARSNPGRYTLYDNTPTTGVTTFNVRAGAGQGSTDLQQYQNSSGTVLAKVTSAGYYQLLEAQTNGVRIAAGGPQTGAAGQYMWGSSSAGSAVDLGLARDAAGRLRVSDGSTGLGAIMIASSTPASASATGAAGTIAWDANYIYVCTATNTWKRVAIATW